ncbi:MAG: hypothetical protein JNK72_20545 [Myxococcales bacterium]|nr:hypothetical protein [Myxococcales bacterium]
MLAVGTRVLGQWHNGSWYPGRIGQVQGYGHAQQFFVEFDDGDTAWLTFDRVRVEGGAQPQKGYGQPAHATSWAAGAAVLGDWTEDSWYEGYIADANSNGTMFFVQFDDGDSKWLPPQKIRPRFNAPSHAPGAAAQLSVGTRVSGEWSNGGWYNGAIARQNINQSMCFVQFDDGDVKWLGPDKIRALGAPRSAPIAPSGSAPSPGSRVSGEWSPGAWYDGTVAELSPDGQSYFIQFDDGDTAWLRLHQLRPLGGGAPAVAAPAYVAPAAQPAWPGAAASHAPGERVVEKVIERQVLVVRCQFCRKLTPVDMSECKECGAKM